MKTWIWYAALSVSLAGLPLFAGCSESQAADGDGDGDGDGDTGDGDLNLGGMFIGDGDGDDDGDGDECEGESAEATPVPVNLLLVVDTSASMEGTPEGFDESKWETLVGSLKTALPEVQDRISMGVKFFPSGDTDDDVCSVESGIEVEVGPGSEVLSEIEEALSGQSPGGDTPTAAALSDALDYFQNATDLQGDNVVLLATDGGPNCNDSPEIDCTCDGNPSGNVECGIRERCTLNIDEVNATCTADGDWGSCCLSDQRSLCLDDGGTTAAVTALADAGIKTIVLGMPGSEAYTDVLDQLASAGGLALTEGDTKYVKVDDPDGLTESISSITRGVIKSCEIQLEKDPPNGRMNVFLDGEVIPQVDEDGWILDESTDPPTVVLTGPTCDRVEKEGVEKISVEFGCPVIR